MSRPVRADVARRLRHEATHPDNATILRRRRRIWIGHNAANRRGIRPGYAWASLLYDQYVCCWFAVAITRDGKLLDSSLASGWRLA